MAGDYKRGEMDISHQRDTYRRVGKIIKWSLIVILITMAGLLIFRT